MEPPSCFPTVLTSEFSRTVLCTPTHAKQDIMIQNISLPQNIADQMAAKTMVKSKQQYEVMEQTFEMQSIRLRNEMDKVPPGLSFVVVLEMMLVVAFFTSFYQQCSSWVFS